MPPRRLLPTFELYAEQLLPLNLGFALYEPDPGPGGEEVRIGDVGYVYDGRFKRIGSVFESGNGIATALEEQFHRTESFTDLDKGILSSTSVRSESFEGSLSGSEPLSGSSASVSLKFSCQSEKGATLVRKYRATVEKASYPIKLKRHFGKYFRSVYDHAKSNDLVENQNEVILVTGRVMTGDWATLAFHNHSRDSSASFDIKAATITARGTLWGKWSEDVHFPRRHGPPRQRGLEDGQEPVFDQCVYIETCRFYDLPWFDRLLASVKIAQKKAPSMDIITTGHLVRIASSREGATDRGPGAGSVLQDDSRQLVLSAYDVLAFHAFVSGLDFNFICIDENDMKRLSPISGTLHSVLEEFQSSLKISVSHFDIGEQASDLRVGKLYHARDLQLFYPADKTDRENTETIASSLAGEQTDSLSVPADTPSFLNSSSSSLKSNSVSPSASASSGRRRRRCDSLRNEHIPRPPNAFVLYRENFVHQRHVPGSVETNRDSLSRSVGDCWKQLPASEKKVWEELAKKKRLEHKKRYPDYHSQPQYDPGKRRRREEARAQAAAHAVAQVHESTEIPSSSNYSNASGVQHVQIPAHVLHVKDNKEGEIPLAEPRAKKALPGGMVGDNINAMNVMGINGMGMDSQPFHLGHRRSSSVPLPQEAFQYQQTHSLHPYNASSESEMPGFGASAVKIEQPQMPPTQMQQQRILHIDGSTLNIADPAVAELRRNNHQNLMSSNSNTNRFPNFLDRIPSFSTGIPLSFDTGGTGAGTGAGTTEGGETSAEHEFMSPQSFFLSMGIDSTGAGVPLSGYSFGGTTVPSPTTTSDFANNANARLLQRAAPHQRQLASLGRRASSTQPILERQRAYVLGQLGEGAGDAQQGYDFSSAPYEMGGMGTMGMFGRADMSGQQQQSQRQQQFADHYADYQHPRAGAGAEEEMRGFRDFSMSLPVGTTPTACWPYSGPSSEGSVPSLSSSETTTVSVGPASSDALGDASSSSLLTGMSVVGHEGSGGSIQVMSMDEKRNSFDFSAMQYLLFPPAEPSLLPSHSQQSHQGEKRVVPASGLQKLDSEHNVSSLQDSPSGSQQAATSGHTPHQQQHDYAALQKYYMELGEVDIDNGVDKVDGVKSGNGGDAMISFSEYVHD